MLPPSAMTRPSASHALAVSGSVARVTHSLPSANRPGAAWASSDSDWILLPLLLAQSMTRSSTSLGDSARPS